MRRSPPDLIYTLLDKTSVPHQPSTPGRAAVAISCVRDPGFGGYPSTILVTAWDRRRERERETYTLPGLDKGDLCDRSQVRNAGMISLAKSRICFSNKSGVSSLNRRTSRKDRARCLQSGGHRIEVDRGLCRNPWRTPPRDHAKPRPSGSHDRRLSKERPRVSPDRSR